MTCLYDLLLTQLGSSQTTVTLLPYPIICASSDSHIVVQSIRMLDWRHLAAVPGVEQDWVVNTAKLASVPGPTPKPPRSAPYEVSTPSRVVEHDYSTIGMYVSAFTPRKSPYEHSSTPKLGMPTLLMG
jgi:hypothetical protein